MVADIERIGSIQSMCASFFESSHCEIKRHYRATSRRRNTTSDETVSRIGESQALEGSLHLAEDSASSDMISP